MKQQNPTARGARKRRVNLGPWQKNVLILIWHEGTQWRSHLPRWSVAGLIGRGLCEQRQMEWSKRLRPAVTLTKEGRTLARLLVLRKAREEERCPARPSQGDVPAPWSRALKSPTSFVPPRLKGRGC